MRILFLDDNKARHRAFKRQMALDEPDAELVQVYTYSEACRALEGIRFDVVYLDHDLGDFHAADNDGTREFTGQDVAHFIVSELPHEQHPDSVIIHSWNPVGARNMMTILKRPETMYVTMQPFSEACGQSKVSFTDEEV